ncbi:MAG: hypothetical protein ACR2P1_17185 [Pseudomonadales bacterium]
MKFHSSIFSFDTLQDNPLRLLLRPTIVFFLVIFLLLEVAVRVSVPEGRIPKGGFYNAELRQRILQLEKLENIDLMFTGSSIAAGNAPPETFDAQLRSHGLKGFKSFNAGIRGCDFSCITPSVEKLFLSRREPRYLVIILSPNDLDANKPGVIARSKKHVESLNQPAYRTAARNVLSSMSWVYGFDAEIRDLLTTGIWKFDPAQVTLRGHVDMGSKPRKRSQWDYKIEANGNITQAFYDLLENVTGRGISVILIPMIGDSSTRANFKLSYRQDFAAVIAKSTANDLVRLVRINEDSLSDESYIDNVHLNSISAKKFGRQVADRLIEDGFPYQ